MNVGCVNRDSYFDILSYRDTRVVSEYFGEGGGCAAPGIT